MKKFFLITILIISSSFLFAEGDKFFTTEASLGTGISIYDSSADEARKNLLSEKGYKRIILGLTLDTNLNISDPLKIMIGTELFSDFLWKSSDHYNSLDYSFFTGIKIFPNSTGLNFSISYVLGNRSDFFTEAPKKQTQSWGNGFRLSINMILCRTKTTRLSQMQAPTIAAFHAEITTLTTFSAFIVE